MSVLVRVFPGDALTTIFDYLHAVAANNPNNIVIQEVAEPVRPLDFEGRWAALVKEFGLTKERAELPALAAIAGRYEVDSRAKQAIDTIAHNLSQNADHYVRFQLPSLFVFWSKPGRSKKALRKSEPGEVIAKIYGQ